MSDPLLALLGDASSLFPTASSSLVARAPILRDRGVGDGAGTPGTPPLKLFSVVKLDCSDLGMCFGMIKGGGAFCYRVDCKVKFHMERKLASPTGEVLVVAIQRSTPMTAFSQPILDWGRIPAKIWLDWDGKTASLENWKKEFQAVDCGDDGVTSMDDVKKATQFLDKADLFRTPSKRKRDLKVEGPFGEDWEFVGHDRKLPSGELELDEAIKLGVSKEFLTKTLSLVEASVVTIGGALEEVAKATLDRFEVNEKDSMLMAGVIQTLKANMGSVMTVSDDKFEAPTLWGTTTSIGHEVSRVGASLIGLEEEMKPFKLFVTEILKMYDPAEAKEKSDRLTEILGMVMQRMKQLSPEFESLKDAVGILVEEKMEWERRFREIESGGGPSGKKPRHGSVDSLEDLMMKLNSKTTLGSGREEKMGGYHDRSGLDEEERADIERRLDSLTLDLSLLKETGGVESVKFGGLGFRSVHECYEWSMKNFPGRRYGLIMDPLLMLERICGADEAQASANTWKTMESRIKLKITTGAEASALEALNNPRPRLFHSGSPSMMYIRNTSRLSKLLKHTNWRSGGGGGMREHILKQMNSLQGTITQDINHFFGSGRVPHLAQAHLIATLSLTASMTSLTQLVGAVDAIYDKLHLQSKFATEAAWCLTMQILDKVCEELYGPKDSVLQAITLGDPDSICAHVLYSSFRSHDVMAGYVDLQFENHPAVSTEFIRFLATNSGSEKVDKLEDMMSTVKDNLTKVTEDTKRAGVKADTASTKTASLASELTAAVRRITALEARRGGA